MTTTDSTTLALCIRCKKGVHDMHVPHDCEAWAHGAGVSTVCQCRAHLLFTMKRPEADTQIEVTR